MVALVGSLTAAATQYEGFQQPNISLNDGGVWVTNESKQLVGRLNYPSGAIDGVLNVASTDFDVYQSSDNVMVDSDGSTGARLDTISPATVQKAGGIAAPGPASPALGGDTIAFADSKGNFWAIPAETLGSFTPASVKPTLALKEEPLVAVSVDGKYAFAFAREASTMYTVSLQAGKYVKTAEVAVEGFSAGDGTQITVVGEHAVLFDSATGTVWSNGSASKISATGYTPAAGDIVQVPGADASVALIATTDGLVQTPIFGGAGTVLAAGASGTPAAPAFFQGCAYGAWVGSNVAMRSCGAAGPVVSPIPSLSDGAKLAYRMNYDFIVLNNLADGNTWLVAKNLELVNNWTQNTVSQDATSDSTEQSDDVRYDTNGDARPDRTNNQPPVAKADEYGVRPGATLLMPVTLNDTDPNGDVLTVRAGAAQTTPELGPVETVLSGTAFQIEVPSSAAPGDYRVSYVANDGRLDSAPAQVLIHVVDPSVSDEPKALPGKSSAATVAAGGTVTYNVLNDWMSPQGDPLYLKEAMLDEAYVGQGSVQFTPDGEITYRDAGSTLDKKVIKFTVADDHGKESTLGKLEITVLPTDQAKPILSPDHVQIQAGQATTLEPLLNDYDPTGGNLTLNSVELDIPETGMTVASQAASGRVEVTSETPGTYILNYEASGSGPGATSFIRVDVLERTAQQDPIAVNDIAVLPYGGSRLVGALDNDSDPLGGVLSISSVNVPETAFFKVEVLQHSVLRISSIRSSTQPASFTYTVVNAVGSATATVLVTPLSAPEQLLPPQPKDDYAKVRAGDVQTVPVLANDTDPQGAKLTLDPELKVETPGIGSAFVADNKIRFQASGEPGVAVVRYNVSNGGGEATATLRIEVTAREAKNEAPQPGVVRGRTVTGQRVTIPVNLSNADANGDSVSITSVGDDNPPQLGKIVSFSNDSITYEAFDQAGTDTFHFTVTDSFGAIGQGIAYVGIAKPSGDQPGPTAVPDQVDARPGTRLAIPVTVNDYSPTAAALAVVPEDLNGGEQLSPEVLNNQVVVQTPAQDGDYTFNYTITDGALTDSAAVVVKVRATAELKPPLPKDDFVPPSEAEKLQTFTVPVLTNDADPMGINTDLRVSLVGADATSTSASTATAAVLADQSLKVTFTEQPQLLRYRVTNPNFDTTADAFVHVPAKPPAPPEEEKEEVKPVRVAPAYNGAVLTVNAGESVEVPIVRYVSDLPDSRTPTLVDSASARATKSTIANGDPMVKDAATLLYATAPEASGSAVITVRVSDGPADDAEAKIATIAIQVSIVPKDRLAPLFTPRNLELEQAGAAGSLDLAALTTSFNTPEQLQWSLGTPLPAGFTTTLSGSTLSVKADGAAGTAGNVPIIVTDGGDTTRVTGSIALSTISSKRPLATLTAQTLDAVPGTAVTVNALQGSTNPFPETPLTVVADSLSYDQTQVTASISGSNIVVNPVAGKVGQATVEFKVADATGDVARQVQGRMTINVKGKPDPIAAVQVKGIGDGYVDLQWAAPANYGSPITNYTVTAASGALPAPFQCGVQTVCRITGLTNNQTYTFKVTATSAAGTSDPSTASGPARPDRLPPAPPAPTIKNQNGTLVVTWVAPDATNRSPDVSYDLLITPGLTNGTQTLNLPASSRSATLSSVALGTTYSVAVRANNSAGANGAVGNGAWSPAVSEKPSKPPTLPGAPSASREATKLGGIINVSWPAAQANGDAVSGYTVTATGDPSGPMTRQVAGNLTAYRFTGLNPNATYSFSVVAANRDGNGPASGNSNSVLPYSVPEAPGSVSLAQLEAGMSTATAAKMRVTWTAATTNGTALTGYVVNLPSGPVSVGANQTTYDFNGTNGTPVSVTVTARNAHTSGPGRSSNSVTPYGKPSLGGALTGTGSGPSIEWKWGAPILNGNKFVRWELSGAATTNITNAATRTYTTSPGYGVTENLTLTLVTSNGSVSQSASAYSGQEPRTYAQKGASCTVNGAPGNYVMIGYESMPSGSTAVVHIEQPNSVRNVNHGDLPAGSGLTQAKDPASGGAAVCLESTGSYYLWLTAKTPDGKTYDNRGWDWAQMVP
ncbi:fibronectin type III domain-containing protein [Micrococcales bacterium 31B]|nr:fibronectin type III domain-containing protein [Micrococcales bacterium 31B]